MADRARDISVIVVGGSYAGAAAAKRLAALSQQGFTGLKVTLVDRSTHYFHAVGFPKALVDDKYAEKSFLPLAGFFAGSSKHEYINQGLAAVVDAHHVELDDGRRLYYDYLVLATGGKAPGPINVAGRTKEAGLAEIRALRQGLEGAESVLVIGGGPVGVEVAGFVAATYPAKRVTLVHSHGQLLPKQFRIGVSNGAVEKLTALGVRVVLNDRVEIPDDFEYAAHIGHRVLRGTRAGQEYASDVQIPAVGFQVHSEYLAPLEAAVGRGALRTAGSGAIRVRPTLQLDADALPHIFVPGDANSLPGSTKFGFKAEMQGNTAAANIRRLIESGFDVANKTGADAAAASAPAVGAWTDYVDLIMLPVGPNRGVAQICKIALGSSAVADFLVRQIKTRDFMLGLRKGYYPRPEKRKTD
ncbi:hypothetical protein IWQ57_000970 [Coemansia nantahalensis]|uniref:Uncharacterized protein n=1 Tax=Coemansia nantahalensis TaxID=2789366 RepID=A0ACC1K5Y8_9FUNG|nr:hypothetical protein IWQ57_000970 [Coemansia nantahalensis]